MADTSDTNNRNFSFWYGIKYNDKINNNHAEGVNEVKFQKFQEKILFKFRNANLYKFKYFDKLGPSKEYDGLLEAVKNTDNYDRNFKPIILKPVDDSYETRNGNKLTWVICSYLIIGIIWLSMILIPKFNDINLKQFLSGKPTKNIDFDKIKDNIKFLLPKKELFFTILIVDFNILIYLIMVIDGFGIITFNGYDLLNCGANYRPLIIGGEYWRLLTSVFLHGGILHLIMNMAGLLFIGLFLEPILGSKRFILFYLLTGTIASLTSAIWHESTVSVGASGAIFGMYGIFLTLLLTKFFPNKFKKSFLVSTSIFIIFNLVYGLTGGIDNSAHLGGLLSGILFGFLIYPVLLKEGNNKYS